MSVEVRPMGVKCNISCHYCYQNAIRDANSLLKKYDLELIKTAIAKKKSEFTLFGGEPLLIPKEDLEDLFEFGLDNFGKNSIQTNGILIDDEHINLFKKYKVSVGVSLDGPGVCNSPRWAGNLERTKITTEKVERNIEKLISSGIRPGMITTLHRANASEEVLPLLLDWFRALDRLGIKSIRLHMLEVDSADVGQTLSLTADENVNALLAIDFLEKQELKNLKFDLFKEIEQLLVGKDKEVSCTWHACDPYTTPAVQGIEGFGQTSNCGRTNKAGVDFLKSDQTTYERYIALFHTPFENGGCSGCRFFLFCKGQCPGTGIDGDWRNRSDQCESWFRLFEHIERRLVNSNILPLSLSPLRQTIEIEMLKSWANQNNPLIEDLIKKEYDGH
jgi:uncharacterized protein